MRTPTLISAAALVVTLAGCNSSSSPSATVTVSGTLAFTAGVAVATPSYTGMPGTVMLRAGSHRHSVTADEHGHFSARVLPGTYVVTGQSPQFTVNGVFATCTAVGGDVDASHDRSGVLVLCVGK